MKRPADVAVLATLCEHDPERGGVRVRILHRLVRSRVDIDWMRFNRVLLLLEEKGLVTSVRGEATFLSKHVPRLWLITEAGKNVLENDTAQEAPKT
jgi:hypothetical protein